VQDPYLNSVLEAIASEASNTGGPHLITVDELRAAGALDVPAAWRKSLGEERDLFSELIGDDESPDKLAQENGS
jgi:hypothetical protein